MAGKIPQQFIEDLLSRIDIIELIGSRIRLKKAGHRFSGLCPFHKEKSPSFSVNPQKGFFYCFGCHAHGDAIEFLVQYDKMTFPEAVTTLANYVGLALPSHNDEDLSTEKKSALKLLAHAARYFQEQLQHNKKAQEYLKARGLDEDTIKQFKLGFAPPGWDNLFSKCAKSPALINEMFLIGLIKKNQQNKYYDVFRDRIMFPIRNIRGQVIGFGGRGDDKPKYLNSPETPLFHKGRELYGLYETRQQHATLERILIVEGYMDVIALSQHGIKNAVATLGTATTPQHIKRLFRYTSEIVFCFDGDLAGQQAALRAMQHVIPLMHAGRNIRFMVLPPDEDPDTLVRKIGKAAFEQLIVKSAELSDFLIDHLRKNHNTHTTHGKASFGQAALALIEPLPEGIFRDLMHDRISKIVGIPLDQPQKTQTKPQKTSVSIKIPQTIRKSISFVLQRPELAESIRIPPQLQVIPIPGLALLMKIVTLLQKNPETHMSLVLQSFDNPSEQQLLAELSSTDHLLPMAQWADELSGCIARLMEMARDIAIKHLMEQAKQRELSDSEKQQLKTMIAM